MVRARGGRKVPERGEPLPDHQERVGVEAWDRVDCPLTVWPNANSGVEMATLSCIFPSG